jgi:hypothetical protein
MVEIIGVFPVRDALSQKQHVILCEVHSEAEETVEHRMYNKT